MADEELTNGEIRRTLERLDRERGDLDDRITQVAGEMVPIALFSNSFKAIERSVTDLKTETREGFERVEKTSVERRDVLRAKDKELAEQIGAVVKGRTAKAANWIAAGLLVLTALGLIATMIGYGGR